MLVPGIGSHVDRIAEYTMETVVELGECGRTEKRSCLDSLDSLRDLKGRCRVQTGQMNGGNPVASVWDPHMMDVMEIVVAIVAR